MPPGWSTQAIQISGITAITWFKTTSTEDGEREDIILPVIWCPDCGGAAKAILIWIPKFPSWKLIDPIVWPDISVNFPDSPSLDL
jgi:hypothetical protein